MWYILRAKNKSIDFLKKNLKKKLGVSLKFYCPTVEINYFKKNKLEKKRKNLLSNYLLCFHEKFSLLETIKSIKYTKGLDKILENSKDNQNDIKEFVMNCKKHEDQNGNIKNGLFDIFIGREYKILNGPLTNFLIKLTKVNNNKFEALVGKIKIVTSKNSNFLETV